MKAAMVITTLRAQELARNHFGAGATGGFMTFEMPGAEPRSLTEAELAADESTNLYEAGGVNTGYAAQSQPSEMPYSPVYEADAYETGYANLRNQNEMPGSPVNRRSELMAGDSMTHFSNRALSPPINGKDLNTGPLVVPDE